MWGTGVWGTGVCGVQVCGVQCVGCRALALCRDSGSSFVLTDSPFGRRRRMGCRGGGCIRACTKSSEVITVCRAAQVRGQVWQVLSQAKGTLEEHPTGRRRSHTHSLCEAAGSVAFRRHRGDRGSDQAHDSSATSSCCPQGLCQGRGQCLPLLPVPQLAQPVPGDTRGSDTPGVGHKPLPRNQRIWWEGASPGAQPRLLSQCISPPGSALLNLDLNPEAGADQAMHGNTFQVSHEQLTCPGGWILSLL